MKYPLGHREPEESTKLAELERPQKPKKNLNGRALSKFGLVYQKFSIYLHWYQKNILKKKILKFLRGVPNYRLIPPKNDNSVKHCSGRVKWNWNKVWKKWRLSATVQNLAQMELELRLCGKPSFELMKIFIFYLFFFSILERKRKAYKPIGALYLAAKVTFFTRNGKSMQIEERANLMTYRAKNRMKLNWCLCKQIWEKNRLVKIKLEGEKKTTMPNLA